MPPSIKDAFHRAVESMEREERWKDQAFQQQVLTLYGQQILPTEDALRLLTEERRYIGHWKPATITPPTSWRCAYCASLHAATIYQCASCGAPRR